MNNVRSFHRPQPRMPAMTVHAPRVFTQSFQERLAALNAADRELRQMGFHSVWRRLAGQKPEVHLHRDMTVSMAPLLDKMGPRSFRNDDGCTVVSGEFKGVIVSWAEPV